MFKYFIHIIIYKPILPILSVLILSYDEMLFSTYLVEKNHFFDSYPMHYLSIMYTTGVLIGSVLWRVIIRLNSIKKTMLTAQFMLLFFTSMLFYFNSIFMLFLIKFFQGLCATGPAICVNLSAKRLMNNSQFNRFLAITQMCGTLLEAFIPAISELLITLYGIHSSTLFALIYIGLGLPYVFLYTDQSSNYCANWYIAIKESIQGYFEIISSTLIIPLLIIGLTEGMIDVFWLNIVDTNIITSLYPIICIASLITVQLAAHFSKEEDTQSDLTFNWQAGIMNTDLKKSIFAIFMSIVSVLFLYQIGDKAGYKQLIPSTTILMSCLTLLNYINAKALYVIHKSTSCITSLIIISERLFLIWIQGLYQFIIPVKSQNFMSLIEYISIYLFIVTILSINFYHRLQLKRKNENKLILPRLHKK